MPHAGESGVVSVLRGRARYALLAAQVPGEPNVRVSCDLELMRYTWLKNRSAGAPIPHLEICHLQTDAPVGSEAKTCMERDYNNLDLEGPVPREQVSREGRTGQLPTEADTP